MSPKGKGNSGDSYPERVHFPGLLRTTSASASGVVGQFGRAPGSGRAVTESLEKLRAFQVQRVSRHPSPYPAGGPIFVDRIFPQFDGADTQRKSGTIATSGAGTQLAHSGFYRELFNRAIKPVLDPRQMSVGRNLWLVQKMRTEMF